MAEMTIITLHGSPPDCHNTPLALTPSENGFTLILAGTQTNTFFVIVQRIGVTVTTIEVARQCYAELLVHLIDQHIRDSSNISTEELKSYITLKASDHSSRTPLLDDFLAP
ncbi:hypothetical protein V6243_06740 [Cobetia marina]|uniref:Uncharacterized protein n=1 Tax=Cobetia marina TaxID=28258 RepID=A0ABU9GDG5_COBMA